MIQGYAVATVRAVEDRVRAGLPEDELMQRAARGLAAVARSRVRQQDVRSVVVLAGPGDNGGDALWAASFLAGSPGPLGPGAGPDVGASPDDGPGPAPDVGASPAGGPGAGPDVGASPDDGPGPAPDIAVVGIATRLHEAGLRAARDAGCPVTLLDPDQTQLPAPVRALVASADLVLDGLLGIGGRAGLRGAMAAVAQALEDLPDRPYVLAVDLPSGADPAGEEAGGPRLPADETVTFGVAKPVHLLPATTAAVGRLTRVDIGLDAELGDERPAVERLEPTDVAARWPLPGRDDHKYSRGVLTVVAGSDAYPGAAVLCSTAAVEAGAGMVRYVGPPRATDLVLSACPEVVPGPGRTQALVVGPGIDPLGCDHPDCEDHQVDSVREAFADDLPLVVDAGALELLAGWLGGGYRRRGPTLLTPHAGELARLLTLLDGNRETTREEVLAAPLGHARLAAELTRCTVLLKGATTLVVDPDPSVPVRSQADAPPWTATAGAGDVLAGVAGVLLAAGLPPMEAGSLAALVHGAAAHRANPGGPVRALGVARAVPRTVAELITAVPSRQR